MWFYKGKSVNISATTQKFIVALFYKINPVQIATVVAENTENSLNLVPHTNLKIGEKFTQIVFIAIQHNLTLLTFFLLLSQNSHKHQHTK